MAVELAAGRGAAEDAAPVLKFQSRGTRYSCPAAAAAALSFQNNIFSNEVSENSFTFLLSLPAQNKKCLCCQYLIQSSGARWIPTGYTRWKELTCILINNVIQRLQTPASGNALALLHYLL